MICVYSLSDHSPRKSVRKRAVKVTVGRSVGLWPSFLCVRFGHDAKRRNALLCLHQTDKVLRSWYRGLGAVLVLVCYCFSWTWLVNARLFNNAQFLLIRFDNREKRILLFVWFSIIIFLMMRGCRVRTKTTYFLFFLF